MAREPVCFTCGEPTGPFPRLNVLSDGSVCPSCRDRLLDTLPPALPGFGAEVPGEFGGVSGYGESDPPEDFRA